MRTWTLAAALACGIALPSHAQLENAPGLDLFSTDAQAQRILTPEGGLLEIPARGWRRAGNDKDYAHALVFRDGRQLRGQLHSFTEGEVVWHRPDISSPVRFQRNEVQRVLLASSAGQNRYQVRRPRGLRDAANTDSNKPIPATVKLAGGNWLHGTVTSADGRVFTVRLGDSGRLTVPREQIEWLYFADDPVPAFGLSGGALDLQSWLLPSTGSNVSVKDGITSIDGMPRLARQIPPVPRFEVSLEIPADDEGRIRLWLQPYGLEPDSYSTGTVQLGFGTETLTLTKYTNKFERSAVPLPKRDLSDTRPIAYRVLFDSLGQRVAVLRNGKVVTDWTFQSESEMIQGRAVMEDRGIRGICFDLDGQSGGSLRLRNLRVQPWDGVIPQGGAQATSGEWLTVRNRPPVLGKLDSISDTEIHFGGKAQYLRPGIFLQLDSSPVVPANAGTTLILPNRGELNVAGVQVQDGRLTSRTPFGPVIDMPLADLQAILLPDSKSPRSASATALVFRNGDELRGSLVSAAQSGPLRWRLSSGQEVDVRPERVAGVRFATAGRSSVADRGGSVELQNGDWLRGACLELDGNTLQLEHDLLGRLSIDRSALFRIFPNSRSTIVHGGMDPEVWMTSDDGSQDSSNRPPGSESRPTPWLYLDGRYILPNVGNGRGQEGAALQRKLPDAVEKFELRCDVAQLGNFPNFSIQLAGPDGGTSLMVSYSYQQILMMMQNPATRNGMVTRSAAYRSQPGSDASRMRVQIFGDSKAGTAILFVNGVFVAKTGIAVAERIPGFAQRLLITPYAHSEGMIIISDLWLGPWSGEIPEADGAPAAETALINGDATPGAPASLHDGKFVIPSDIGPLELPIEKVHTIQFGVSGGELPRPAARVRLRDGGTINVASYQWESGSLTAHSASIGDLKVPEADVAELIVNPEAANRARPSGSPKLTRQEDAEIKLPAQRAQDTP